MAKNALVIGAGFAGAISAQQLASNGYKVRIVEKRNHIGGNAYDSYDENGILIHNYGPHIFHTNSKKIFEYLSNFTDWRFYEHRVLSNVNGKKLPIPINRTTINELYNLQLSEDKVADFFEQKRVPIDKITTSEDVVLNSVGHELCDYFFRNYTKKQWGLDLNQLSAGVAARIPTRTNDDDRYFTDNYQFMPSNGYTKMFENLLDNKNITIELETEFIKSDVEKYDLVVFTGPIDLFYEYQFGKLPYRSLEFKHEYLPVDNYQPVGTVNYPNDFEYTRITEFKHLTGQKANGTSLVYEYPRADGDPYYPIPRKENEELFQKYKAMSQKEEKVLFLGRLAEYRYYNMDQVAGAALAAIDKIIG